MFEKLKLLFRRFIHTAIARDILIYETTRETMAYNANGSARDYVPAGWQFQGWGDSTWRYASADALPFMKKGWRVAVQDTKLSNPDEPIPGDTPTIVEIWFVKDDGSIDKFDVVPQ